jgi:hypothetical protein
MRNHPFLCQAASIAAAFLVFAFVTACANDTAVADRYATPTPVQADAYPAADSGNKPPDGFTALFNGSDLVGWWGAGNDVDPLKYLSLADADLQKKREASLPGIRKHWTVRDGELINDGHGLFLTTEKYYGDFELLVDYKTVPLADSGVYLRGTPQVQIWDYTEKGTVPLGSDKGSGALGTNRGPGRFPLVKADRPFGEWNRLRIVMVGTRVWTWLNGQAAVAGEVMENYFNRAAPLPPRGPILLQTHGGEIRWRNIFIREIANEERDAILQARAGSPQK